VGNCNSFAAADNEVNAAADEARARRPEATQIGHDLPAGSEPPG
jgi:hypothetical protein